ncbi:hypothetical protein OH809_41920 [Streptomyces sp. NBC_00873]|uniref:hypothetical protein n=1 Tax=unclassified Streptomyces TaxID=2593676 RepID=UPI003868E457|nr:hypothetical protein OH809_01790 [Streptomyces sp. NBC_00873]WSY96654.1 hypothetical protein OH809_41920 [Streptomyces sp. NBC_00873]WTA41572.1 hypothetical protein OH821_01785 [Streptomyces sp. NBC_00842]WTA48324.1 hypothetical protein OH821_42025 [Streptomyces sp. NBC_00842]
MKRDPGADAPGAAQAAPGARVAAVDGDPLSQAEQSASRSVRPVRDRAAPRGGAVATRIEDRTAKAVAVSLANTQWREELRSAVLKSNEVDLHKASFAAVLLAGLLRREVQVLDGDGLHADPFGRAERREPGAADIRERRATTLCGWWHAGSEGRHAGVRRCALGQ